MPPPREVWPSLRTQDRLGNLCPECWAAQQSALSAAIRRERESSLHPCSGRSSKPGIPGTSGRRSQPAVNTPTILLHCWSCLDIPTGSLPSVRIAAFTASRWSPIQAFRKGQRNKESSARRWNQYRQWRHDQGVTSPASTEASAFTAKRAATVHSIPGFRRPFCRSVRLPTELNGADIIQKEGVKRPVGTLSRFDNRRGSIK